MTATDAKIASAFTGLSVTDKDKASSLTSLPPSTRPSILGKWQILGPLGKGAYGRVKLAAELAPPHKRTCLKFIDASKLVGEKATYFDREIKSMQAVRHANVLCLTDAQFNIEWTRARGNKQRAHLLVLELAEGGDLFGVLRYASAFTEPLARTYFHQLIAGLDACHRAGIAHRDLKPENILLDGSYVLKIADFGLARHFDNSHQLMYSSVGTPLYLPPEMRTGRGTYEGPTMDIWAAGMLLFIMISGVPPWGEYGDWYYNAWTGGKQADFWRWHEQYGHPFSAQARELLTQMMQVDPARRATIDAIKASPWYNGPTVDDTARATEMKRRADLVKTAKHNERLEAARKKEEEQRKKGVVEGKAITTGEKHRGAADGDAPPGPVGWNDVVRVLPPTAAAAAPTTTTPAVVDPTSDVLPDMPSWARQQSEQFGTSSWGEPVDLASLAPVAVATRLVSATKVGTIHEYNEAFSVACYTSFITSAIPALILERIARELTNLSIRFTSDYEHAMIKGSLDTRVGALRFFSQIYSLPPSSSSSSPTYIVQFHRTQGDSVAYYNLYDTLSLRLGDMFIAPSDSHSSSAPSSS